MGRQVLALMLALTLALVWYPRSGAAAGTNWLEFDVNAQHSGNNTAETAITASNVSTLHSLFQASLPDAADGAPVYLSGVTTSNGIKDLVFVTTMYGSIVALDAHTGTQVWSQQYGPNGCRINRGSNTCYTTSSPAIDPGLQYVYSYGLDGRVHRFAAGTGTEVTTGGWPELVTTKPFDEKESPALSVVTTSSGAHYLYVGNGGYPGDNGDYQGHLTTINLDTGAQHVFTTLCSNQTDVHFVEKPGTPDCPSVQSAVWARSGAVYDAALDRVFIATGNGDYAPSSHDWGDSVLALNANGTGASGDPVDSFTPKNYASLQANDTDLGSTAPAILPTPASSHYTNLAVQGGKEGALRLLTLTNLSRQGGPGHIGGAIAYFPVQMGGEILTAPAVWVNPASNVTWTFVANGNGIAAYRLIVNNGTPSLQYRWSLATGGTSPIVAGNVLYVAKSNLIRAINPLTGKVLWSSTAIGTIHWQSPIVVNGTLYIEDNSGKLNAFVPS